MLFLSFRRDTVWDGRAIDKISGWRDRFVPDYAQTMTCSILVNSCSIVKVGLLFGFWDQELSNDVFDCIVRRLENLQLDMANQIDSILVLPHLWIKSFLVLSSSLLGHVRYTPFRKKDCILPSHWIGALTISITVRKGDMLLVKLATSRRACEEHGVISTRGKSRQKMEWIPPMGTIRKWTSWAKGVHKRERKSGRDGGRMVYDIYIWPV